MTKLASLINHRLAAGFGANFVGKIWVAALQIISLPLLSRYWGANGLGLWLMLITIPNYIGLSAAGLGAATATEMSLKCEMGEREPAKLAYQSSWLFITLSSGIISLIAVCLIVSFQGNRNSHIVLTSTILVAYAFSAIQSSILTAVYRAIDRYATGVFIIDMAFFIEGLIVVMTAAFGGGMILAAIFMLISRTALVFLMRLHISRLAPWFFDHMPQASINEIKRLSKPALGTLFMSLSTALSLQSVVVLLGLFASPAAAASYSAARTLCRVPLQATDIVNRTSLPELTRMRARKDVQGFKRANTLLFVFSFVLLMPSLSVIATWGPGIMSHFSGGQISFEPFLFPVMCAVVLIQGLWLAASQGVTSGNGHYRFTYPYLALSALMALGPVLWGKSPWPGTAVAATAAIAELIMLGVVWRTAARDASNYRLSVQH